MGQRKVLCQSQMEKQSIRGRYKTKTNVGRFERPIEQNVRNLKYSVVEYSDTNGDD
ncbi:hypothetical protein PZM43_10310 [Staphylococcus epidermidis]|uniref:hypothetical protein n=1 Tax=Staphylococcus TaxID=1279 RepID=UPI001E3EF3F0|nr:MULTISPECIES: hypothetical protein [Staphylococcus]MDH9619366.1 hypothetical protein [Staphylococcus epidermidis]MDH9908330.1 hypothetical protein [Staphylococcus epidermidis]MDI0104914.1 hypothetical protein [Staphylococcus epidermidis]MDU1766037.1 hypothetical protein [Staphylococcus epidermidis]MDU1839688.1 hypothetical protein [Staphylococcus epidermidis]